MNIGKNNVKRINRIFQKYKVSFEFVLLNFSKVIQLYKYVTGTHVVIKRKLVKKNKKVVIKYNTLRKSLFSLENKKKRQNCLRWSTRVVQFIKKQRILKKNQDEIENVVEVPSDSLSPEEIQKKLKEQLELLKSGKKTVPLIGGKDDELIKTDKIAVRDIRDTNLNDDLNETQRGNPELESNDELENIIYSQNLEGSNERLMVLPDYAEESNGTQSSPDEDPLDTDTSASVPFKSMKFLDLLINKMQIAGSKENSKGMNVTNTTIQEIDETSQNSQNLQRKNEFKNQPTKKDSVESLNDIESMDYLNCEESENILKVEVNEIPSTISKDNENTTTATATGEETSSSSSEFLGFTDYELVPSTIPGMLPTPVVAKSKKDSQKSAFISEDLDKFLRENSLQSVVTSPRVEVPKRYKGHEEGLMCDGATPPKMIMPVIPEELTKPRTVAEKRYILQRKQSIKYYMIENENTIYRELKKRTKHGKANTSVVRCIQNLEVPCTRDCWKASAWLCTDNGRFYFQMLKVDDVIVKLVGGSGNHVTKYKPPQLSRPPIKLLPKVCSPGCRQNVDFRNIVINLSDDETEFEKKRKIEHDLKLQIGSIDEKPALKPGPLSSKCMYAPFQPNMGELEIYKMPKVKLEVFPEVDKPLDEAVKPYLKYILPSSCITREWAEFAVSTVVLKTEIIEKDHPKSFTFTIPYLNNQNNILVRKMYNRKEKMEKFSTKDFEFRKEVEGHDEIATECADILSEMINSVAIGLSEDSLLKDDPDIDYSNNTRVNEETVRRDSSEEKVSGVSEKRSIRMKKNKLVLELKKLNATVIDAESLCSMENKRCKIPHCRYGCVCQSISGKLIKRKYCKKNECMLLSGSCKHMASSDIGNLMNSSLSTENALLIRRKATEKLAKVEKDFCATVVLTDKETFVLNEPTKERKRSKRIPKRFDDYQTAEGKENNTGNDEESIASIPKLYPFDDEPPPKKFKHCTVDLYKLEGLEYIEPWCMIHCLYKCFCKGESTTGVPFKIKKEETIVSEEIAYPRRPIYSFDKETTPNKRNFTNSEQSLLKRRNDSIDTSDRYESSSKMQKMDVDANTCRRIIPVSANIYQTENRRKATQVRRTIRTSENDSTKFMLINKVQKSLQFRTILPNNRSLLKTNQSCKRLRNDSEENAKEIEYTPESESNINKAKFPVISSVCSLSEVPELNLKLHRQSSMHPSETSSNSSIIENVSQFLKTGEKSKDNTADYLTNTPETSSFINHLPATATKVHSKLHNQVISKLNLAVTRSMHSICKIQLNNTKKIPDPVPNTLSCHQWNLFLQAYVEGTIYIWEIRITTGSFLAATVTNFMPMVPNALSVINIKAIAKHKLPLVGKMLNARFINDKTKTLSVLLTGHHSYWRIIGFIHSTYDYLKKGGYFKPTPHSHPCLSKKINLLYNIMILRQIHSTKRLTGESASATITSQQLASETELESSEENTRLKESGTESSVTNISQNTNAPELYAITSSGPSIVSKNYVEESVNQLHISENRTIPESNKISSPVPSIAVSENYVQVLGSDKSPEGNPLKMDKETVGIPITQVPKCNLEIKRVSYKTIEGIVIPIAIPGDHRWLVLDIVGDFSHIYIPDWKNFLNYDKIKKAIMLTQRTRKIVRIGQDKSTIDVFAAPDNRNRIYLGPYDIEAAEDIVLYQNIDGRMMLREDFEISHNISRVQRTCGFWLYKKFGKLIFDIDLKSLHISKLPLDDDCVIVDDKLDPITEQTETVYAVTEDGTEESNKKFDVTQQPIKVELPLHIDLDSVRTLQESDSGSGKKVEIPKVTSSIKPLHVTKMQVARISTKLGINNLKIIKDIEASSVLEKSISSENLETEISRPTNPFLIPEEIDQPQPVVPNLKDLQLCDVSKEKEQSHPTDQKLKDLQICDISKGKEQYHSIEQKPKDPQVCDVSISPISQHSSDMKCYGPTTSQDSAVIESATSIFKGNLVSAISKQSPGTRCYGPALASSDGEIQNRMRRNSLSSPMSLLIQALKPTTSIATKKTGLSSISVLPNQKIQPKPELAAKLISVSPSHIATPTSKTNLINSQRACNSFNTFITKSTSPTQSMFSIIKPGSSSSPQISSANSQIVNTKIQKWPKTIFVNTRKADAQITSEGSNHQELIITTPNGDLRTTQLTSTGDKNKTLEESARPMCGFIVCKNPKLGTYSAKRLGDFYFLKIPGTKGVYRLRGMDMVNKYLNCHISKQLDSQENMCWKFLPSKVVKHGSMPTIKSDRGILNGSFTKSEVTSTITSTTQQENLSRKLILTMAKNTNVLQKTAAPDSLTLETESKLQKLKNFTVKKTAISKDPRLDIRTKEKWTKVNETPLETVKSVNPNSLLRKVLSLPAKLPPVPPPEKTSTLLTPPTVKTPPPVTLPTNSKTPSPEIFKGPLSTTVITPLPVIATSPPPAAVANVSSKPLRQVLQISIKPACDEVILIDDDE